MIKIVKESDLIYLASFIDGEGSLYIRKTKPTAKRKNPQYAPILTIANTNLPTLEYLFGIFEYGVLKMGNKPRKANHRQVWTLTIQGYQALEMIEILLPYMRTKQEEAREFLRFRDIDKATGGRLTEDMLNEREEIFLNLQQLKKIEYI